MKLLFGVLLFVSAFAFASGGTTVEQNCSGTDNSLATLFPDGVPKCRPVVQESLNKCKQPINCELQKLNIKDVKWTFDEFATVDLCDKYNGLLTAGAAQRAIRKAINAATAANPDAPVNCTAVKALTKQLADKGFQWAVIRVSDVKTDNYKGFYAEGANITQPPAPAATKAPVCNEPKTKKGSNESAVATILVHTATGAVKIIGSGSEVTFDSINPPPADPSMGMCTIQK